MSEAKEKIELKVFIESYVKAQKDGKTVNDLCTELGMDVKEYAAYRNRMTKLAAQAKVEVKPLARKERSPNTVALELRNILKDAFGEEDAEQPSA